MLNIGCDPELICRLDDEFVPAYKYFKHNSSFGTDGLETTAELRPGYCSSPVDLCAKIRVILELGHDKYPELELFAGHYVDSRCLGGHIHFNAEPSSPLISSLDTVLEALSNETDDPDQKAERIKSGYGRPGAFRKQPHGFEYRTPGSWLISPTVSLVTLTLAKLTFIGHHDNLNFGEIKTNLDDKTFLLSLGTTLKTIPDDCVPGMDLLDGLLSENVDWTVNILKNWGIAA